VFAQPMAMKTSRAGGRQQQLARRTHTGRSDDDDDDDDDKSQDSLDSPGTSPRCLSRDEVLAALGYRSQSPSAHLPPQQAASAQRSRTACRRCTKTVYPLELIDIGDSYHRRCFKCYVREHSHRHLLCSRYLRLLASSRPHVKATEV